MPCSFFHFTYKTPSPSESLTFPTHNAKTSERHKCKQTLAFGSVLLPDFFPTPRVCLWFVSLAFNIVTFKFNPPLVISQAPPPWAKNRGRVIKTGKSNQTCFLRRWTLADEVPSSRIGCNIATISLCVRRRNTRAFPHLHPRAWSQSRRALAQQNAN